MIKPFTIIALAVLLISSCQSSHKEKMMKPNIIYILADDLGYGDLSCLNENSKIKTPNIDRMAHQGIQFTDAHSNSSVCTPTRYGILTGRYAWRTSLKNGVLWSYDPPLIHNERSTIATLLKKNDYHTACIGKWHLGLDWSRDSIGTIDFTKPILNGPNENGFDYFYGITASLDIPPYFYIENDHITAQKVDTIEAMNGKMFWRRGPIGDDFKHMEVLPRLTEVAMGYIDEQANTKEPFFLYFPLPAPHTPILPSPEFQGKSNTNEYGDFVLMVDDVLGQIMNTLEKNGILENTLVVFSSDNGCSPMANFEELANWGHDPSYVFRGYKADIYEGGHRIPLIMHWPQVIQGGGVSEEIICSTDFMATLAEILEEALLDDEGEDSYSMWPLMKGLPKNENSREAVVHHSVDGYFSIRKGKWKLEFCAGSGGWSYPRENKAKTLGLSDIQLYDLEADIVEKNNIAGEHPLVVQELSNLMLQYIREGRSTPGQKQNNEGDEILLPILNTIP